MCKGKTCRASRILTAHPALSTENVHFIHFSHDSPSVHSQLRTDVFESFMFRRLPIQIIRLPAATPRLRQNSYEFPIPHFHSHSAHPEQIAATTRCLRDGSGQSSIAPARARFTRDRTSPVEARLNLVTRTHASPVIQGHPHVCLPLERNGHGARLRRRRPDNPSAL